MVEDANPGLIKGGIALQFLKHKLCMSDEILVSRINTDWSMMEVLAMKKIITFYKNQEREQK